MTRILSVSYDLALLSSRRLLLESLGYHVVSAADFPEAMQQCQSGARFDLFVLGHSIPGPDKENLITAFRARRAAPVIALKRPGEEPAAEADFYIDPEPGQLLAVVSGIISSHAASA